MAKKKEDTKEAEASKQKFAAPEIQKSKISENKSFLDQKDKPFLVSESKTESFGKTSFSEVKAVVQSPDYNAKAVRGAKCISCNVSIVNDPGAVKFSCPNCGQYTIIRCSKCRKIVAKYKCPVCRFEGPN